ncbi:MAG: 3-hydroxyacyl-CoA dehydrogenase family protein [Gammaproteobacteria bacterium]|nr:3-hydroxyacyl-CoA dehydrogenase family protein [Gammaproteobacteria bacterium]
MSAETANPQREIKSVAVLGAGTMGSGIAAACAQADCNVLLLDISNEAADKALERMQSGRAPALDDANKAKLISTGNFDDDLDKIQQYDWVCEAVVEDLETKRNLFKRVEKTRREGTVVSTNTSGIPLRAITQGMPDRLRKDIAVTHFFNPVKVMRLLELVPGEETSQDVTNALAKFCKETLGKGVVHGKDTVNFIGNRIGCFWMLSGLHKAKAALDDGLNVETIDALMSKPVGLPPTGLYGLIDLIGLDVMDLVAKNLDSNLPPNDIGRAYNNLPAPEQEMLNRGQLGRKTGGGFYRVTKLDDGGKLKEVFDLTSQQWRTAHEVTLDDSHLDYRSLIFGEDTHGRFVWDVMGGTLCYAADLVPEISDDIVNIDRAMRWGFNWRQGPFQQLDALNPGAVIEKLTDDGKHIPQMLAVLRDASVDTFYRDDGRQFLGSDGSYHRVPEE